MIPPLVPVPKGLAKPTDKLCDSCAALKLTPQDFVVRPGTEYLVRYSTTNVQQFGLVEDVKEKSLHCPLCRLVLRALGLGVPDEEAGVPLEVIFRWSTDGPPPYRNELHQIVHRHVVREINIGIQRQGGGVCDYHSRLDTRFRLGILANDAPTRSKSFFSRVIKDQIDFNLVRNWISICNERHKNCAGVHRALDPVKFTDVVDEIRSFRVIDVVDKCITLAPRSCQYAALSYVWGQAQPFWSSRSNIVQLEKPGALVLPENHDKIPLTIRDAILVVKELGMRYLWVDSLCIIQDDGDRMQTIEKIHVVFGASALTITAASGVNANAGLPGVHAGTDRSQLIVEIQPGFRLVLRPTKQNYTSASMYYTRGWMFQEQSLAKRNLIFIGGQVSYTCTMSNECREDEVSEDRHANPKALEWFNSSGEEETIREAEHMMSEYSDRLLTYEQDIYHAFDATITVFQRVLNANLCHGIPDVFVDWFLLWEPHALQKRRSITPSWSWSGWTGKSLPTVCENSATCSSSAFRSEEKRSTWIVWYQRTAHDSHECVRINSTRTPSEDSAATQRIQACFTFTCSQTLPTLRTLIVGKISVGISVLATLTVLYVHISFPS
ncbi:hypothetical protein HYPSUDRAFT_205488 [Hypholoma sublateritium FD-334 SS-4]|uniref:Heterokaryon incompatibility domain-containing protein n=1 Tax=Hypholoma sublateritium (strain FD-334 SS-4) TaxID=945553 RepID=A0A0D2PDE7_HYPSF|nr:hypothetical protein HYPSUDRAFT_205488 [Hypholoma sublateritium FD-334 SS-4]